MEIFAIDDIKLQLHLFTSVILKNTVKNMINYAYNDKFVPPLYKFTPTWTESY
jgi:hypothetical protein